MADKQVVKAGRLLQLEGGEYSDYSVYGFYVALRDFNPFDELDLYFQIKPEQKEPYNFERDQFIAFVIAKGYLLEVDPDVLYIGSYSSAEFNLAGPV